LLCKSSTQIFHLVDIQLPLENRREARKLGLLPEGKSFEAERERMEPQERNERVFKG
jgi:hypothetical protein